MRPLSQEDEAPKTVSYRQIFHFISITVAELGIQEAGYVILLGLLGVPIERAAAFTLINRLLFTVTDMIGPIKIGIKNFTLSHAEMKG